MIGPRTSTLLLALLVLAGSATLPAGAAGQRLCSILLGCGPETPVVTPPPPPPPADPCAPLPRSTGGSFVGMVSEDIFWYAASYRGCTLNDQAASGVDVVRQTFDWALLERGRNRYDFSWYDGWMADVARRRMQVLPILFNAPRFRSSRALGSGRGAALPRRYDDMGRFAARLVRRYGPRGSFWRAHPDLPRVPVRAWQVWNEPNVRAFWPTGPDPVRYTRLLKVTAAHIRKADPRAEIVTAGIPDSALGTPLAAFVAGMYAAGAGPAFDTLAIHAYSRSPTGVPALARRVRRLMDRHGDRRAGLRISEFGWASSGPPSRFRVSPAEQAKRLSWTLRALYAARARLRLRGVVYYSWRDGEPYPPHFRDFSGLHTGLLDTGRRPKPAYHAFRAVAPRLR